MSEQRPTRVCVVGSGWMFTSGISYYTARLSGALADRCTVSAILMRRLVPQVLYPGRDRVGVVNNALEHDPRVTVHDGVDWWWGRSMLGALRLLRAQRPDVLLLEWWTGAVLHSYLLLAVVARLHGATVLVEFHEVQDTGEARLPLAGLYARVVGGLVLRLSSGAVVHSSFDRHAVGRAYDLGDRPVVVAPHGPFDHHVAPRLEGSAPRESAGGVESAGGEVTRLLFFGTVRPYKGLEHLVAAFQSLDDETAQQFTLDVVGETWEGWQEPVDAARTGRHSERVRVVNRYVHDDEVATFFAGADAVVLPYLRSSASGPLHIAMAAGLPVVLSDVGGLRDAAEDYAGVLWVPPGDVDALAEALTKLPAMRGQRFADPRSWGDLVDALETLPGFAC